MTLAISLTLVLENLDGEHGECYICCLLGDLAFSSKHCCVLLQPHTSTTVDLFPCERLDTLTSSVLRNCM